ncbi:MAG: hypothetical protein LKE54_03745 [Prevotella sp.]|jgi:hypothetical protein|nr:hypothetical protein [Prevotella sp.]MCH3994160.1 hypothetical protein [Prevotella sp.]
MTKISKIKEFIPAPKDGAKGETGPLPYPAGVWDKDTTYIRTESTCPYVIWKNGYWYLTVVNEECKGIEPTAESKEWHLADKTEWVFAKIAMMEMGKLAAAVFSGNYMFSQFGTLNGEEINDTSGDKDQAYKEFDSTNPTDESKFVPNLFLDFLKGILYCKNAKLQGEFKIGDKFNYIEIKKNEYGEPIIELHCDQNEQKNQLKYTGIIDPVNGKFELYGFNGWKFIVNDKGLEFSTSGGEFVQIAADTGVEILGCNITDLSKNGVVFIPVGRKNSNKSLAMVDGNGSTRYAYIDANGYLRAEDEQ